MFDKIKRMIQIKKNRKDPCFYDPLLKIDMATDKMPYDLVSIDDFKTGFGYWGKIRKERLEKIFHKYHIKTTRQSIEDEYNEYLNYYLSASELNKNPNYYLAKNKNDDDIVTIDDFIMGKMPPKYNYLRGHIIKIIYECESSKIPATKKRVIEEFDKIMSQDTNRARELSTNKTTKEVMQVRKNYLLAKGMPVYSIRPYEEFEEMYYKKIHEQGYKYSLEGEVVMSSNIADIVDIFKDIFDKEFSNWR